MKISLNWLKEFVKLPVEPRQLKADLTMIGVSVESFAPVGDDWALELEITTNRPDCLSHYGVAREASTFYRAPLKPLKVRVKESGTAAAKNISIEISDPDLCARYCGRVIQDVRVQPSPGWLVRRLETVGMRPINNVADVTNYVLMELGHPLHAFDLARLEQQKIVVRRARPGEKLRTLDRVDRALARENLVIADAERAVALAGVMGGEDTEISSHTRSVVLESAWFDPVSIRRTAKAQGMHTEASHRFERGADIEMAPRALDRAAELIAEVAGGEVLRGIVDVYPAPRCRPDITLRPSEIVRLLGTEVPGKEVERIFRSLSFKTERRGMKGWRVKPPSSRLDVAMEVDLIEEVARHYGYGRLPARVRPAPPRIERDQLRERELAISAILVGLGYREIITSSMVDPAENARFTDRPPVPLLNPLSQEASALRSTPIPSMLGALRWNLDRDRRDLRLLELGKTYTLRPKGLPDERRVLTLGLGGRRRPATIHDSEKPLDFFDIKGDLETVFEAFDTGELRFEPDGGGHYESGLGGRFVVGGEVLATFGQLSREIEREYKLRENVWIAEIEFERLLAAPLRSRAFRPYSKFPAVERDFSLIVPETMPYGRLREALLGLRHEEIQSFYPVNRADRSKVPTLPSHHYSLLIRVTFQSLTRTLTAEQIAEASKMLLATVEPLGVRLRV
jgi:phenylalanyl-tRNA synthetase beta chain